MARTFTATVDRTQFLACFDRLDDMPVVIDADGSIIGEAGVELQSGEFPSAWFTHAARPDIGDTLIVDVPAVGTWCARVYAVMTDLDGNQASLWAELV